MKNLFWIIFVISLFGCSQGKIKQVEIQHEIVSDEAVRFYSQAGISIEQEKFEEAYYQLLDAYRYDNKSKKIIERLLYVCSELGVNAKTNPTVINTITNLENRGIKSINLFNLHYQYFLVIKDYDKAETYARKIIQIKPSAKTYVALIYFEHYRTKKYNKKLLDKALKYDDADADLITLGTRTLKSDISVSKIIAETLIDKNDSLEANTLLANIYFTEFKNSKRVNLLKKLYQQGRMNEELAFMFSLDKLSDPYNTTKEELLFLLEYKNQQINNVIFQIIEGKNLPLENVFFIEEYFDKSNTDPEKRDYYKLMFAEYMIAYKENEKALEFLNQINDKEKVFWVFRRNLDAQFFTSDLSLNNHKPESILPINEDFEPEDYTENWNYIIENINYSDIEKKILRSYLEFQKDNNYFNEILEETKDLANDNLISSEIAFLSLYKNDIDTFLLYANENNNIETIIKFYSQRKFLPFPKNRVVAMIDENHNLDIIRSYAYYLESNYFRIQAIQFLEKFYDQYSYKADFLNSLGYLMVLEEKDLQTALKYLERAININPSSIPIWDSLAWCYFKLERFDDAFNAMQKIINKDIKDSTIAYHFAEILYAKNDLDSAKKFWMLAIRLGSDKDAVKKSESRIIEFIKE